jgi:hypothetical protein
MSTVMEQLEGRIDTTVDIGVHCGSRPMLVAAVSHFAKLDADLEVLGSGPNMRLTEDEVNALWSQFSSPWTRWCCMLLFWLLVTLLTAWESCGGSLCR